MKTICRNSPWWPLGVGIGAAMGVATGDTGLWLAIGLALGLVLDGPLRRRGG